MLLLGMCKWNHRCDYMAMQCQCTLVCAIFCDLVFQCLRPFSMFERVIKQHISIQVKKSHSVNIDVETSLHFSSSRYIYLPNHL